MSFSPKPEFSQVYNLYQTVQKVASNGTIGSNFPGKFELNFFVLSSM